MLVVLGKFGIERLSHLMQLAEDGEIEPSLLWSAQVLFVCKLVIESFQQLCFKLVEVDSESLLELILF